MESNPKLSAISPISDSGSDSKTTSISIVSSSMLTNVALEGVILGIDTDKSASVFCVDVVTAVYASFSDIVLL